MPLHVIMALLALLGLLFAYPSLQALGGRIRTFSEFEFQGLAVSIAGIINYLVKIFR